MNTTDTPVLPENPKQPADEKREPPRNSCACSCPHQCPKTKVRSDEEVRSLMNRLSRIEGQVRGVRGMVERNAYCTDILTQVAAVTAALNAFNRELLGNHIRTCVANNLRAGHDEVVDELMDTLQKLLK